MLRRLPFAFVLLALALPLHAQRDDNVMSEGEIERVRRRFGMLFQSGALLASLTVGENVALPLREHTQFSDAEIRKIVMDALDSAHLKLLFPLIFCIFPSLMVVLMGPAMIQIYRILLPSMGGN